MMNRTVYIALALTLVLALLLVVHRYLWSRLIRATALSAPWRELSTALLITLGGILLTAPLATWVLNLFTPAWFNVVAYSWLGALAPLLVIVGTGDILRRMHERRRSQADATTSDFSPDRRRFLARAAAAGASVGAIAVTGTGIQAATSDPEVVRLRVPIDRLPVQAEGLKIAQISDLHVSGTIRRSYVRRIVSLVQKQRPDLIVITGDLVDGSVELLREDVAPLADLEAPLGVFFCTGNHDFYSGIDPWIAEIKRLGIRPLRNERVTLGEGVAAIDLAGVDDHQAGRFVPGGGPDLDKALRGRVSQRALVLLAHQPKIIDAAARAKVDLVLSGHTHGGQIWPFGYFVALTQPYLSGLHRHEDSWIYVSRGTGYWGPPVRIMAPQEISLITLTRAPRGV